MLPAVKLCTELLVDVLHVLEENDAGSPSDTGQNAVCQTVVHRIAQSHKLRYHCETGGSAESRIWRSGVF